MGQKKYEATVVAQDKVHDLALLHANAADWPVLQLADSDRLELGQEVRVVGFPLSTVLGNSIKITRGILSGIIAEAGEKLLQVDAGINHGNSGGPLVNERGEVVGVVSAILNPQLGSNVGFAQPINAARTLLEAQAIRWEPATNSPKLEGAELARRVIPSAAYILVTPRPATSTWHKLVYRVELGPKPFTGFTVVDSSGAIHEEGGAGLTLNLLGTVGFEPLAREGERHWGAERAQTFVLKNVESTPGSPPASLPEFNPRSSGGPTNPLGGRSQFTPQTRQQQAPNTKTTVISISGIERARYEILNTTPRVVTIKKTTFMATLPPAPGRPPMFSAQGEGLFEFDRAAGVVRSSTFTVKLVGGGNSADTSTRTLTYQRIEGNTLANLPTMPPPRANTNASSGPPGPLPNFVPSPDGNSGGSSDGGSPRASNSPAANAVEVPSAAARSKAEGLLADLFEKELAALDSSAKRIALARVLLKKAGDQRSGTADHYVLLDKARDLAMIGGDLNLTWQVIDRLTDSYQVNGLTLKAGALATLAETVKTPDQQRRLASVALNLLDRAIAEDDIEGGRRLGKVAYVVAHKSGDKALIFQTAERGKAFKAIQKDFEDFQHALARLKDDPQDAAASTVAGKYYCLVKDDWSPGLPLLAQGDDPVLAKLATQELAVPADGNAQFELAEGWNDLAKNEQGIHRARVQLHARTWYQRALPTLSGLAQSKAEKSLAASPTSLAAIVSSSPADLNPLFDSIAHAIRAGGLPKTREVGLTADKEAFRVVPEQGALLVGFDINADDTKIAGLRPIFLTAEGHAIGRWCGVARAKPRRIVAKLGYAVGAVNVQARLWLTGLSLQFMEIGLEGLNPAASYQSDWLGHAPTSGSGSQVTGEGSAVIGIHGHAGATEISSLGLVLAPRN